MSIEQILHEEFEKKYIDQYKTLHEQTEYTEANNYEIYIKTIKAVLLKTESQSLLDFGCGKALHYSVNKEHLRWGGIMPHLYDPAVEKYSKAPEGKFDGVICIDVLEHIPEILVEKTLKKIYNYATKFVYLVIDTKKALWSLPNGENAHSTIKSPSWWSNQIKKANRQELLTFLVMNPNKTDQCDE